MITTYQVTAVNEEGYCRTMARNLKKAEAEEFVAYLIARNYTSVVAFPEGF